MKPLTEPAQMALDVMEALCRRAPPNDCAWVDELLLEWSRLSAGRSAIGRALARGGGVWDGGMREQTARSFTPEEKYLRPSSRSGVHAPDVLARAEELSEGSPLVREQDLVAALVLSAPQAVRALSIDGEKFVDQVRGLEGTGPTASTPTRSGLLEADELASRILERLEAGELLSSVLPAARRFAERAGHAVEAAWLHMESVGLDADRRKAAERTAEEREGVMRFMRLHAAEDITAVDVDHVADLRRDDALPDRSKLVYHSIAMLERAQPGEVPAGGVFDRGVANAILVNTLFYKEAHRIIHVVRQEVHRFVSNAQTELRTRRRALELFGPDAVVVLDAGGALLDQLRFGVAALDRVDGKAAAAMAARTSVQTLGRELNREAKGTHSSPRTGGTFQITSEMHRLFALLDDLWQRSPERRPLLEAAYAAADEAYEIGSRAKDPAVVTDAQATAALRAAFTVARALALCGVLMRAAAK